MSEALPHADELRVCAQNRSPVLPKTCSPIANSLMAGPSASISPVSSPPRIRCLGRRMPDMERLRSETTRRYVGKLYDSRSPARLTVVAWILRRTSSVLGTGRSISSPSAAPIWNWQLLAGPAWRLA